MRKIDEKKLLIITLGIINALENKALSVDESGAYIFRPAIIEELKTKHCNTRIIILLEKCLLIEDYISIIPSKLDDYLMEIKKEAVELLASYEELTNDDWGMLFKTFSTDVVELFSVRGNVINNIIVSNNQISIIFETRKKIVFKGFVNAEKEAIVVKKEKWDDDYQIMLSKFIDFVHGSEGILRLEDAMVFNNRVAMNVEIFFADSNVREHYDIIVYSRDCFCNWM